jgi:hypothetical protein
MPPRVEPGTKWVLAHGAHSGNVIDIVRVNKTGAVIRNRGGGKAMGNQKVDDTEHRVPLEYFASGRYVPYQAPAADGATSFRQRNAPREQPAETPPTLPPLPKGELQMQVVDVTPAQAQAWLDNGGANRTLKERVVDRYAAFMLRGEWRVTGEAIKLDEHARVRDGQHRLAAIVRSGMTVPMLVIRGVDESAFDVMDTGKARTPGDVLSIHGYGSTMGKAAAIRSLMLIEVQGHINASTVAARGLYSGPAVLAHLQAHPEIEETYPLALQVTAAGLAGGPGTWGTALTLFWRIDPDATREMARYLISGAGMHSTHPLLVLRNRAVNRDARLYTRSVEGRQELLGMIIKAWNAWRRGEDLIRLSWKPKEPSLPEIDGAPPAQLKQVRIPSLHGGAEAED